MYISPELAVKQMVVVGHVNSLVSLDIATLCGNCNLLSGLKLIHPYLSLGLVEVSGITFLYPSGLCNQRVTECDGYSAGKCFLCICQCVVHADYTLFGKSRCEKTVKCSTGDALGYPLPSIEVGGSIHRA